MATSPGTLLPSCLSAEALEEHLIGCGLIYRACCDALLRTTPLTALFVHPSLLHMHSFVPYLLQHILLSELDLYIHRYCIVWSLSLPNAHSSFGSTIICGRSFWQTKELAVEARNMPRFCSIVEVEASASSPKHYILCCKTPFSCT